MEIKDYGKLGEMLAVKYLKKHGYKIIATNYSNKVGEVDIIALETRKARRKQDNYKLMPKEMKKENNLVFVEVKSRRKEGAIRPSDAVDHKKKTHYSSVAMSFMSSNPKYASISYRFDIIEIIGEAVKSHLVDAF